MAGQAFNWLADKLLIQQQQNNVDLGRLRAARKFDRNNFENVINSVTGRTTTDRSKRLAVAQGLGLQTQGLIIGGKLDGEKTREQLESRGTKDVAGVEKAGKAKKNIPANRGSGNIPTPI